MFSMTSHESEIEDILGLDGALLQEGDMPKFEDIAYGTESLFPNYDSNKLSEPLKNEDIISSLYNKREPFISFDGGTPNLNAVDMEQYTVQSISSDYSSLDLNYEIQGQRLNYNYSTKDTVRENSTKPQLVNEKLRSLNPDLYDFLQNVLQIAKNELHQMKTSGQSVDLKSLIIDIITKYMKTLKNPDKKNSYMLRNVFNCIHKKIIQEVQKKLFPFHAKGKENHKQKLDELRKYVQICKTFLIIKENVEDLKQLDEKLPEVLQLAIFAIPSFRNDTKVGKQMFQLPLFDKYGDPIEGEILKSLSFDTNGCKKPKQRKKLLQQNPIISEFFKQIERWTKDHCALKIFCSTVLDLIEEFNNSTY